MRNLIVPALIPTFAALVLTTTGFAADTDQSSDSGDHQAKPQADKKPAGAAGGSSAGAAALSQLDRDFIEKAASGGMFEVASSQLLLDSKLKDDKEKEFARMMIADHSKANTELIAIAQQKGIDPPKRLLPDNQQKLDELKSLTGATLEKRYHDLQVESHKDAIALFEHVAKDSHDPQLKKFATNTLPTLRLHAQHLETHERSHDAK